MGELSGRIKSRGRRDTVQDGEKIREEKPGDRSGVMNRIEKA
jgi:hypothetical protein